MAEDFLHKQFPPYVAKKGEDVTLVGFGTFHATSRPARTGRNPRTGASIEIPASRAPKFRAGKALKDAIN